MGIDVALQPGAERVLAAERGGKIGGLALGGSKRGLGLSDLGRQRTHLLIQAGSAEFNRLELYEVFNQSLHP
jgi:hypothetical protein